MTELVIEANALTKRYGVALRETSQTAQRHTSPGTSAENGVSDSASGDSDVSDDCDVSQGGGGDGVDAPGSGDLTTAASVTVPAG